MHFSYNYSTTYITCPADPKKTLGIKLPFLVMIIKNLKKYFTFEVQVSFLISMLQVYYWWRFSIFSVCVKLQFVLIRCFVSMQVLDDKNVRRRFRASNYQSTTRVKPFICTMPMRLDDGWNQIQFNLSDFTRRAYGTNYIETLRVQVRLNYVMLKNHKSQVVYEITWLKDFAKECVVWYLQIHANCRIRRVYFSDRLYSEDELPAEFKLYLPVQNKTKA